MGSSPTTGTNLKSEFEPLFMRLEACFEGCFNDGRSVRNRTNGSAERPQSSPRMKWSAAFLEQTRAELLRKNPESGQREVFRGWLITSANGDDLTVTLVTAQGSISITRRMVDESIFRDGVLVMDEDPLENGGKP